jgi:hypothetical protein
MPGCNICGGRGHVDLPFVAPLWAEPAGNAHPVMSPPTHKRFPCPECQRPFGPGDIVKVNAGERFQLDWKDNQGYTDHFDGGLARVLGNVARRERLVEFQNHDEPPDWRNTVPRRARLLVLKPEAWRRPGDTNG